MSRIPHHTRAAVAVVLAAVLVLAVAALAGAAPGKGKPGKGKAGAGSVSAAQYQYGPSGKQYAKKAIICHKGKTITVGKPAVKAHTRHGDTMGRCP
jgi:hypothetical protein